MCKVLLHTCFLTSDMRPYVQNITAIKMEGKIGAELSTLLQNSRMVKIKRKLL